MALTEEDYENLILSELNASDNAALENLLPLYWELHADKGSTALQYLFTKRSAVDFLLGSVWEVVTAGSGATAGAVNLSDQSKQLQAIRESVTAEIEQLQGGLRVILPTVAAPAFIGTRAGEFG